MDGSLDKSTRMWNVWNPASGDNKSPVILTVNKESHDDWEGCTIVRKERLWLKVEG